MAIVTLVVFFGVAARLWSIAGLKIPLICTAIWIASIVVAHQFGIPGYAAMSVQAILATVMLLIEKWKSSF